MMRMAFIVLAATSILSTAALAKPTTRDPAKAPAGTYELDARHASLTAKVAHMGFSNYAIRFDKLAGGFAYDPANFAGTRLTVTVDPKSVHTGLPAFDTELAGGKFLDAAKYPAITFVSTAVEAGPDGRGKVTGDLTFLGVTKPVTLDVVFNGAGPGLMGAGVRMGFSGIARINRSDFGLKVFDSVVGDEVSFDFEIEFVRK